MIFGKLKVGDDVKWHFGTETCTGVVKAVKGKTIIIDTGEVIFRNEEEGAEEDMSFWNIHVRKDGQAVITLTEQFGVKPTQIIRPANKDLILTDNYLEVDYKGQKLYLPFNKVWYPKTPTPYGFLVAQGYLQKQPMNLLNMLYELFSLILYNNNPVVVNKLPIDVQALFNKYQKISNKFDFVDFAVIGNSIPLPY